MGSPDDSEATGTFWDHLDALRGCLLKAAVVVALCGLASDGRETVITAPSCLTVISL